MLKTAQPVPGDPPPQRRGRSRTVDDGATRKPTYQELQDALMREHRQRCQLEGEMVAAMTALDQLRSELAGSQAGERRARHLALHDSLTSLPNACYFRERLDQVLASAAKEQKEVAVLFLDLDRFKPINDMHGHAAGDELLSIIAARLMRTIRADDMVCRLGGDEFACLLLNAPGHAQLSRLACKMFDAVSDPVRLGSITLCVHPSIGIAVFPEAGATAAELLQHADAAMYQAKRLQTGYAFFCQDQTAGPKEAS
ncbi:GGDEF domain-containing protein [Aquabacterium sp.]|uniref:GGDEF domain-containing protein n=1 Tax=Aquabacterium sp. TaxID=1872578 RepID=UPI002E343B28|nr:GGDEF domain-containing protein [Aquabacterium sp.]HEX5311965.1 GGDEF domain-containing protein [Aquabacterium sp.]